MADLPVYTVTVSREDGLWVAEVAGLPAGATDVDRFDHLGDAVRDLIATLTDTDPADFWVEWRFRHGSYQLFEMLRELREWERQTAIATESRDAARKELATEMHRHGLSYREIAEIMAISHQRVAQIVGAAPGHVGDAVAGRAPQLWSTSAGRLPAILDAQLSEIRAVRDRPAGGTTYAKPLENALLTYVGSLFAAPPPERRRLLSRTREMLEQFEDEENLRGGMVLDAI